MPRFGLATISLFFLLSGVAPAALATSPIAAAGGWSFRPGHAHKEAKQEILDLEQQWRNATLNGDATLMDKLLSDDYVGVSWTGQVNNKTSQLERLRVHSLTITKVDISDLKVKLAGAPASVAIVSSRAEVEGSVDGKELTGAFRYTRIYQRQPNGVWKITNSEATRVLNGPVRRGQMPPGPPPPPHTPPPK